MDLADISFELHTRDPVILSFELDSAVAKRLPTLGSDFLSTLDRLCRGRFDMKRMRARLEECRLQVLQTFEASPVGCILDAVTSDALYGREEDAAFSEHWTDMLAIDDLLRWTENDWRNLMATWLIDSHCVTLTAVPSAALAAEQADATKARVKAMCQRLGRSGLASLEARLTEAKQVTTKPVPSALLSTFTPPDAARIVLPRAETARNRGTGGGQVAPFKSLQATINKESANFPYFLQFDHYTSSFVSVCAYLSGPITDCWPLFVDSFFSMPVQRQNGQVLTQQEAYRQLDDITVGFGATACSEGKFSVLDRFRARGLSTDDSRSDGQSAYRSTIDHSGAEGEVRRRC